MFLCTYCSSALTRAQAAQAHNTEHLMTGPEGSNEFCFPRISMFPQTKSRETLGFEGNKIQVICYIAKQNKSKFWKTRWGSSGNFRPPLIMWNSCQHFAGNSELFPVWRHSFRNVARSWHLVRNSYIVRCFVSWPMNGRAVAGKTPAIYQIALPGVQLVRTQCFSRFLSSRFSLFFRALFSALRLTNWTPGRGYIPK